MLITLNNNIKYFYYLMKIFPDSQILKDFAFSYEILKDFMEISGDVMISWIIISLFFKKLFLGMCWRFHDTTI